MDVDEQVSILRKCYVNEIDRVYNQKFQMRLVSVMMFAQNRYLNSIKTIEIISGIIERAYGNCNPKRMLMYLIILKNEIDELINKMDHDYIKIWDNKLTH